MESVGGDGNAPGATSSGSGGGGAVDGGGGGAGEAGGPPSADPAVLLADLTQPRQIRCDKNWLYWVEYNSGDVYQGRIDSPDVRTQFQALAPHAASSAIRDDDVLYALPEVGKIVSLSKDWSEPSVFAEAPGVKGIYAHGNDVYWFTDLEIHGPSGVVLITDDTIHGLAADDNGVYFTTDNGVYWADLDGHGLSQLSNSASARAIAVSDGGIVFGTSVAVYSIDRDTGAQKKLASASATTIVIDGDVYAWSNKSDVYVKRGDEDAYMIDAVYGDGGVAICDGRIYWASPDSGIIYGAAL